MTYTQQQLLDFVNISRSVAAYCRGIDRLDPETMKSAYWPDAHDERFDGDAWSFVDDTLILHAQFQWTMHCVQNHLVEFDSETSARGEVYLTAYLRSKSHPTLHTFFGRYLDLYEKRDDEWRIKRRAFVYDGSQTEAESATEFPLDVLRKGTFDRPSSGPLPGP